MMHPIGHTGSSSSLSSTEDDGANEPKIHVDGLSSTRSEFTADNGEDFDMSSRDYFRHDSSRETTEVRGPIKLNISAKDVTIQVCSDLHTEFYGRFEHIPDDIIVPKAPILALLGDIGLACTDSLKRFLHHQAGRFEHVLFVAGNHEYYNPGRAQIFVSEQFRWLKEVCAQKDNLHFLERESVEINGVLVLGTTLWSRIPRQSMARAQMSMNDYNKSYIEPGRKMTARCTNHQFHASLKWLEDQISHYKPQNKTIVILTHHTPLIQGTSNPMYIGSELNCCFSTDLSKLLQSPVKYWACGHTHWNFDLEFDNGNVRLVSNQRGYPEGDDRGYDNEGLILAIPKTKDARGVAKHHWRKLYRKT